MCWSRPRPSAARGAARRHRLAGRVVQRGGHRPRTRTSRRWCRRHSPTAARSPSRAPGRRRPRPRAARSAAPRSGSTAGFSYAAQVVEVSVDEDTGAVTVERVWVAHDCGRALNPLAVEGQVQGAVWMGMGQALSEETQYHEGLHLRANFIDYRMPTIAESPPIERDADREHRPARPVRRQGGQRRRAARLSARARRRRSAMPSAFARASCRSRPTACSMRSTRAGAKNGCVHGVRRRRRWKAGMNGLPEFTLQRPTTPREAAALLAAGARALAGGTDLLPNLRHGLDRPAQLVDLSRVAGLDVIDLRDGVLTIGAGVTLARLSDDARIAQHAAGAGRSRTRGGRPRSSQRGHAGRQPVPGHALRVLQPERSGGAPAMAGA